MKTIQDLNLVENSKTMGHELKERLKGIAGKYPHLIGDVRGRGLMLATEFCDSAGNALTDVCKAVQKQCLDRDLLLLTCSPSDNTIRWIPPLIVEQQQIDEAVSVFEDAMNIVNQEFESKLNTSSTSFSRNSTKSPNKSSTL